MGPQYLAPLVLNLHFKTTIQINKIQSKSNKSTYFSKYENQNRNVIKFIEHETKFKLDPSYTTSTPHPVGTHIQIAFLWDTY